jgi:hypothetical protein
MFPFEIIVRETLTCASLDPPLTVATPFFRRSRCEMTERPFIGNGQSGVYQRI